MLSEGHCSCGASFARRACFGCISLCSSQSTLLSLCAGPSCYSASYRCIFSFGSSFLLPVVGFPRRVLVQFPRGLGEGSGAQSSPSCSWLVAPASGSVQPAMKSKSMKEENLSWLFKSRLSEGVSPFAQRVRCCLLAELCPKPYP